MKSKKERWEEQSKRGGRRNEREVGGAIKER
jgi:hypothetical protein